MRADTNVIRDIDFQNPILVPKRQGVLHTFFTSAYRLYCFDEIMGGPGGIHSTPIKLFEVSSLPCAFVERFDHADRVAHQFSMV